MTVVDSRTPASSAEEIPAHVEVAPPDPRDPRVRLEALFDEGSLRPLNEGDDSGALAGVGRIEGMPVVAFASDPRIQGGAMGSAGCEHIVHAYDHAVRERLRNFLAMQAKTRT